jgi:hypothetical protein
VNSGTSIRTKSSRVYSLFFIGFAFNANAHYPLMQCELKAEDIECEVGFSDGTKAIGKEVKLITYDEEILGNVQANHFSKVSFKKPSGEYYLYFDSGHEFPVEVDYGDL